VNFDSFCLSAVLRELEATCVGAFLDQVYQPDPLAVTLAFSGRGPRRYWLLSADARWPRAHAITTRRPNPDTPPGFCLLLRRHLTGSRLLSAEQPRFDRILRLTFGRGEGGATERRALVLEMMGRHSNLALLDETDTVLGALKVVPPSQSRVRPVLPGQPYVEPPGARPDPRALDLSTLRELLSGVETPDALTCTLSGWGTFPAREAFAESAALGRSLTEVVHARMEQVRLGEFAPTVFEDEAGRPRGVWAFPSRQEGWLQGRSYPAISPACEAFYSYREAHAETETLRRALIGVLERARKTSTIQLAEAEGALNGLDVTEGLRIRGELLAANAQSIPRGATEAELSNWYDPDGATLRIPLDPLLDARENADRYFHRYRRATAAAEAALDRIPTLAERVATLNQQIEEATQADGEQIRQLHATAREQGLFREASAGGGSPREVAEQREFPAGVRVKRVPVGEWVIYYGENATSNDYLTTRWARPGDLWLHARAVTGCHVVVRGVNTLDRLPPEVLREAARLAAAHSEAKHSGLVSVDYTFRRYVRKPRGSAPGRVTYTGERTLEVEPR
jgi:predicted ribosome quality control (RQC) complex YloA/Tae2 family protein